MENAKKIGAIPPEKPTTPYKVSQEDVDRSIMQEQYIPGGHKTTVCILILDDGYEVVGTSSVIDPVMYDFNIGKKYARENALKKVWDHLASIMQWKRAIDIRERIRMEQQLEDMRAQEESSSAENTPKEAAPAPEAPKKRRARATSSLKKVKK